MGNEGIEAGHESQAEDGEAIEEGAADAGRPDGDGAVGKAMPTIIVSTIPIAIQPSSARASGMAILSMVRMSARTSVSTPTSVATSKDILGVKDDRQASICKEVSRAPARLTSPSQ